MIPRVLHLTSHRVPLQGRQLRLHERNSDVLDFDRVKVWHDDENLSLIRRVEPAHAAAFSQLPHGVMRADISRLLYLYTEGGWYSDTDYYWVRDPTPLAGEASIVLPVSRDGTAESPAMLGNAVMASEPGHPFWMYLVGRIFDQSGLGNATKEQIEELTGPGALTAGQRAFHFDAKPLLPPRHHFHSPGLRHIDDADVPDHVYGYHLVEGTWRPPMHRIKSVVSRAKRRLK